MAVSIGHGDTMLLDKLSEDLDRFRQLSVLRGLPFGSAATLSSPLRACSLREHTRITARQSKAAVIHFARTAALEYGRYGIRMNSVSPGLIWRDGLDLDWPGVSSAVSECSPIGAAGPAR
jgi:NAD(P)-dependent dehydrogenase (short-subunit alcohol dehydrogenase family)